MQTLLEEGQFCLDASHVYLPQGDELLAEEVHNEKNSGRVFKIVTAAKKLIAACPQQEDCQRLLTQLLTMIRALAELYCSYPWAQEIIKSQQYAAGKVALLVEFKTSS